jgi:hypothetical protein
MDFVNASIFFNKKHFLVAFLSLYVHTDFSTAVCLQNRYFRMERIFYKICCDASHKNQRVTPISVPEADFKVSFVFLQRKSSA